MPAHEATKRAIEVADECVFQKYGSYEFKPATDAHQFWLSVFDTAFARFLNQGRI